MRIKARIRPILLLVVTLLAASLGFVQSGHAGEQPTLTIEVEVLNADGTAATGFNGDVQFDVSPSDGVMLTVPVANGRGRTERSSISYVGRTSVGDVFPGVVFQEERSTACTITRDGVEGAPTERSGSSTDVGVRTAVLEIEAGDAVECVYTYRLEAPPSDRTTHRLEITKRVVAHETSEVLTDESGTFSFDVFTDPNAPPQRIDIPVTDGTGSTTLDVSVRGGIRIVERSPTGRLFVRGHSCTINPLTGSNDTRIGDLGDTKFFSVAEGDAIECRFTSAPNQPQLEIVQRVEDADGNLVEDFSGPLEFEVFQGDSAVPFDTFPVPVDGGTGSFRRTLDRGGEIRIADPGSDERFASTSWQCTLRRLPSMAGKGRSTSLFTLVVPPIVIDRENDLLGATCTFTSVLKSDVGEPDPSGTGKLVIRNRVEGGDGAFRFTGPGIDRIVPTRNGVGATDEIELAPGRLTITQQAGKGFTLDDVTCDAGAPKPRLDQRAVDVTIVANRTISCTFINTRVSGRTVKIIRNFLLRRGEQLLSDTGQPRLVERQRRPASASLRDRLGVKGDGSLDQGSARYRTSLRSVLGDRTAQAAALGLDPSEYGVATSAERPKLDIWSDGRLEYFRSEGDVSGRFGVVRVGADYLIAPNVLIGALAQYDYLSEKSTGYEISGKGFMVGPYAEFRLADGLFFDTKALWGRSTNDISPFRTYTDEFTTNRWLASARISGSWTHDAWHVSPRAEIAYFSERSERYIDGTGGAIDGQRVSLGQFKAGPKISYRHITADGVLIEPHMTVEGIWAFGHDKAAQGLAGSQIIERSPEDFQLRMSGGVVVEGANGVRLDMTGHYSGLGQRRTRSGGGKVSLTVPF